MAGSRKVVKSKKGKKMMKGGAEENKIQIYDASNNILLNGILTTDDGYFLGIGKTSKFYLETDLERKTPFVVTITVSGDKKSIKFQVQPPPSIIVNTDYEYTTSPTAAAGTAAAVPTSATGTAAPPTTGITSKAGGKRKSKKSQKKSTKKSKKSKSQKKSKK